MSLRTEHLFLNPFTPEQLIALIEAPETFAEVSGYPAATGLREFFVSGEVDPAWLAKLRSVRAPDSWTLGFAVIDSATQSTVGSGGFKGPPDADGVAEIAYAIAPPFQGRGYATELARALTAYCFDNGVKRVRAHTLPVKNASNRILTKIGFGFTGEVNDPDDGPVWRWEREADPFDLNRFIEAQEGVYDRVLSELRNGRKQTHWMWFVFPQIAGLGSSAMSHRYSIRSVDEARAYLNHPLLGPRLLECASAILEVQNRTAREILGKPDDMKLKSCATLFAHVSQRHDVFERILDKYCGAQRDERTLELIRAAKS